MKSTPLFIVCFVVFTAFELHRCTDNFADYSIDPVDNSTVRLDFTIPNIPKDDSLLLVKVSIKNPSAPDTQICSFMHFDGSAFPTQSCTYDYKTQQFSVTRSMEESDEELWELSVKLRKNETTFRQLINMTELRSLRDLGDDNITTQASQAGIAGGVSAGVILLVFVVVVVVVRIAYKRKELPAAESVTYTCPHEIRPASISLLARVESGYLKPVCVQPKNSHMYVGSPDQEEELPYDNFEFDIPTKTAVYKTAKRVPRMKRKANAAAAATASTAATAAGTGATTATATAADSIAATVAATAAATGDAVTTANAPVCDDEQAGKGIYPEEEFYENTSEMDLNLQSEELYENYN